MRLFIHNIDVNNYIHGSPIKKVHYSSLWYIINDITF